MATDFTNIAAEIGSILSGLLDSNSNAVFADVKSYPTNDFSGLPAAAYYESDEQSAYATVKQNQRTYIYTISIFYPLDAPQRGPSIAQNDMREVVGNVINAFDKSVDLNGTVDFLNPVPSVWGTIETSEGAALVANVSLYCRKDFPLY